MYIDQILLIKVLYEKSIINIVSINGPDVKKQPASGINDRRLRAGIPAGSISL